MTNSLIVQPRDGSSDPSINWMTSLTTIPVKKTRRTRASAPVYLDIFKQCSDITSDPHWKQLFDDATVGKFPAKFSYIRGCLCYKNGQQMEIASLSSHPENAKKEFIDFFQHWGKLYSDIDQREKLLQSMANREGEGVNSWSLMKKKKYREQAVSEFITRQSEILGLTKAQTRQLRQVLNIGLLLKYFDKDNIYVEDYLIQHIDGLAYNSDRGEFYILPEFKNRPKRAPAKSKSTLSKPKTYGDRWFAYHAEHNPVIRPVTLTGPQIIIVEPQRSIQSSDVEGSGDESDSERTEEAYSVEP